MGLHGSPDGPGTQGISGPRDFSTGEGGEHQPPGRMEGTPETPRITATKWGPTPTDLTEKEKRKIVGKILEISIICINENHVYGFNNRIYKQLQGGATGLRLTGLLARVHMDQWSRKMQEKLEYNLTKVYCRSKYVDDNNMAMESIGKGTRWVDQTPETEGQLKWKEEWEKEDQENEISHSRVTLNGMLGMANSISPRLTFTGEIPEDYEDSRLPMLDFSSRLTEIGDPKAPGGTHNIIQHSFYQKPVSSQMVMMETSAQPHRMKIATLSQEVQRRMANTGRDIKWEERAAIIIDLKEKMIRSGYERHSIENVIESGL